MRKEKRSPCVLIATPNNMGFCSEYVKNAFFVTGWLMGRYGIKGISRTYDQYPLSVARNEAAEDMLTDENFNFTHIFYVDADNIILNDGLMRLLNHNLPVTSGYYLSRKGTGSLVVMKQIGKMPKKFPPKNFPFFRGITPREFEEMPEAMMGLKEVHAIGAGCLLIRRDVFDKIKRPFFKEDWGEETNEKHKYGEDLYFSLNCRFHGIPIYVDYNVFSPHLRWEFLTKWHYNQMLAREE